MNRFVRLLLFAIGLLCLFLAASAFALRSVQARTEGVRQETIAARKAQLAAAIALLPAPTQWDDATARSLGRVLGAEVKLLPAPAPAQSRDAARWNFEHRVDDQAGHAVALLRVSLRPPPTAQLVITSLRAALLCTVLALAIIVIFAIVALFSQPAGMIGGGNDDSPQNTWHEVSGITQLAQVSARQGAELERERNQRQLAEDDLRLKQHQLEKAFSDKVQMGRDLHDGIIQSLYATGLTLQTVRRLIATKPDQAALQLEGALRAINATIGEIRGYINGLTTAGLRQAGFNDAVQQLTSRLATGREVDFEVRIDDEAAGLLNDSQFAELLQVVREAVSNGLRHGGARSITVRLHRNEDALCLLVQDDGKGFTPETTRDRGHGLANMEARARRLGGALRFQSAPGQGTRIVLTFAAPPAPSS